MNQRRDCLLNGSPTRLEAPPGASLLSALRHDGHSLGTRVGCAEGHCGACTVLVDGRAIQSCTLPLSAIDGAEIISIEGYRDHPVLGRVREAFLSEQAAQCGYCTNGLIMTVTAVLARVPSATRGEIIAALDERHLCRCGAHTRILRAVDRLLGEGVRL